MCIAWQAFSWAAIYRMQNYNPGNIIAKPDGVFASGWRAGVMANGALVTIAAATNATNGSCAAISATLVRCNAFSGGRLGV